VVPVVDPRLEKLAKVVGTETIIPSVVEFYDIAGLVAGAHKGEGLGNQFLAHIREVSLLIHVLRYFEDEDVVKTGADPLADFETVKTELVLKDLETIEKQVEPRGAIGKDEANRWKTIVRVREELGLDRQVIDMSLSDEERELVSDLFLLTSKPALFVLNIGEEDLNKIGEIENKFSNWGALVICAKLEAELAEFSVIEREEYLKENNLTATGLDRLVKRAFEELGLISFLTAGEKEVRSWTIEKGTKAPQAAGVIHTDFEKNFIKAQVANYKDFVTLGGWKGAKEKGKVRSEGRDYVVMADDVVEFMVGR
jgi:hypothetical protein